MTWMNRTGVIIAAACVAAVVCTSAIWIGVCVLQIKLKIWFSEFEKFTGYRKIEKLSWTKRSRLESLKKSEKRDGYECKCLIR